jgi:intracellular septation protein A
MMTHTSPLSQNNVKQSSANNNNNDRGSQFRLMLPTLLINAVVPFVINMLARPYMSTINALLLASAVPALFTLGSFIVKKRIDAVGILVVASLLLTAVFALLFKSPRLLLIQTSAIMGLFGVVMLISLLFHRPALFYLVRSVLAQNDPQRFARFNADWSFPQIRSFYRTLTAVWGCVNVAHLLLQAILAFTLPIPLMLVLNPILSIVVLAPVVHWSRHITRKNKPIFDRLRQQRALEHC